MKKLIPLLLLVATICSSWAQSAKQGRITYAESMKITMSLPPEMQALMDSLPKERIVTKSLYFNEQATLYKNLPKETDEQRINHESEGMRFNFVMKEPMNIVFTDLASKNTTEQKEFMDRTFLIAASLDSQVWKLGNETEVILGFPCMTATREVKGQEVKVWFTPNIPIGSGPAGLGNLPGLILKAVFDDGKRVILATHFSEEAINTTELKAPKTGKKVTKAEFNRIVEEKTKEMEAEFGGSGGGARIIIRN